jgi:dsRNA-specific ribonuclease
MSGKPNGHADSDSVGDTLGLGEAADAALADSIEAAQGAIILRSQLTELQVTAARKAERATIETLAQDAMRRYVEAMQKGDYKTVVEAAREIIRLEIYLSRRGFV